MAARLPQPGGDNGNWGNILNDFLAQSHTTDGKIKPGAVTKSDVGLGNVNNTADTDKPISTATQTALNAKVSTADLDSQVAAKVTDSGSTTAAALAGSMEAIVADTAFNPDDDGDDIWAVAGQSNSAGYGLGANTTWLDIPVPGRIRQYANPAGTNPYPGQIVAANDPLAHREQPGGAYIGHAMRFARGMLSKIKPNRRILLVPSAMGSTGFLNVVNNATWDRTKSSGTAPINLALELVANMKAAKAAAGSNARYAGVLWLQGEADSGLTGSAYAAYLDDLIDFVRSELGAPDLPWIIGQMVPAGVAAKPNYQPINAAHIDTPRRKLHTAFAYGPTAEGTARTDDATPPIHYSATGQRAMGDAMLAQYSFALTNGLDVAPMAPISVTVNQSGTSGIITVNPAPGRTTDRIVQYRVNSGSWTTLAHAATTDITFTATGLTAGSTFQARVATVNETGTSDYTNSNTITLVSAPGQVTGLATGTATPTSQPLTWNAVAGAQSYLVEYRTSTGPGVWTSGGTVTTTSATVTGLAANTSYDYRVTAYNPGGSGTASSTVTASTPLGKFTEEVGVAAHWAHSLRRLVLGYNGPAVRVRRSSDNTETDIGFATGSDGLDTTALLAFTGSNSGYVTTIYDQSGNNRHKSQSTASLQARIVNAGTVELSGGKPCLNTGGATSGGAVYRSSSVGLHAAGKASMMHVVTNPATAVSQFLAVEWNVQSTTSTSLGHYIFARWVNNSGLKWRFDLADDTNTQEAFRDATVNADGAIHQYSTVDNGNSTQMWSDAAQIDALTTYNRNAGAHALNETVFFARPVTTTTQDIFYTGKWSESVAFATNLNTTQRQAGEANQKAYFATP